MLEETILTRIVSLAIPPAWMDVWICPLPNGHLQASGRDQRQRKQYRYHPRWREVRDLLKYERLIHIGEPLPCLPGHPPEEITYKGSRRLSGHGMTHTLRL